jgi:NAD-dependent SIR2 family protein deacetylase
MSIDIFEDAKIRALIDHFGSARKMAIFVGAGSSIEAGLPSWEQLVQRLLDRSASDRELFANPEARQEWVDSMLRVESLMGAASVVEGLLGERLQDVAAEELFRGREEEVADPPKTAEDYSPGPIAMQIAKLREAFDDGQGLLKIYTTNYDNLLEGALRTRPALDKYTVYPYLGPDTDEPKKPLKVRHLHGYLGGEQDHTAIVLTERSYFGREQENSWERSQVTNQLGDAPALFLGTSLTDINIIRYLYQHRGKHRHAVVLVRQAEIYSVPESVRSVREQVAIDRWDSANVDVVFVDHYSDVAQLLSEIARKHIRTDLYVPLPQRAKRYFEPLRETVLRHDIKPEKFMEHQDLLNRSLAEVLDQALQALKNEGIDLSTEDGLESALWLVDPTGQYLTCWAATDRIHCQFSGLQTVKLNTQHRFVASTAFCNGTYAADHRNFRNSRWSYIVGIPLWTRNTGDHGRIPIGAMTVMTQTACDKTKLASLDPKQRAYFARVLAVGALTRLDDFRETQR